MKLKSILILPLICLLWTTSVSGQNFHTKSNRALKYYDLGKRDYDMLYHDRAEKSLLVAVSEDIKFYEAHILLGQLYSDTGDWEKAVRHYRNAIALDSLYFTPALYSLGRAELRTGRYASSKAHLEAYLKQPKTSSKLRADAASLISNCIFALSYSGNMFQNNPMSVGDSVNTVLDEYWPSVTGDGSELIFTREVKRAGGYGRDRQEDFYISRWSDGNWGTAKNAGTPLNTAGNEGAQSIASDGRSMYFTACDRNDGHGRCDIYYSAFDGKKWSPGVNAGSPVNSPYWESQPSINANGRMLFFVSNRPGGIGGMDIWYSVGKTNGKWNNPINPGKTVNTPGDEFSPFIYFNGKTLYFSSNGRESFGGFDIYATSLTPDSTWSDPVNLGPSVNTPADETGLVIESSGFRAFFSSVREKEMGKDIFYIDLPENVRPEPVSYLKGTVIAKSTGKPLKAAFELTDLTNKQVVIASQTGSDGGFFVCLPSGCSYGLNVSASGYMIYSENFDFEDGYSSAEPYRKTIKLNNIRKGEFMRMYNVFYDTDSWKLLESSAPELENLLEFLTVNSTVVVEVGGHTDSDGTEEHNQVLSENRARSVKEYLVKRGIGPARIFSHGYGESRLVSDNETPAGKRLNRRTEITILSEGTN